MKTAIAYVHGKGGNADECAHYRPLFPDCDVLGLDYRTFTPWEAGPEIRTAIGELKTGYENVILIANSIGAFFSMNAGIDGLVQRAYFISPIVDMKRLIPDTMAWAGVPEQDLKVRGTVSTAFGEDLSWDYLCWVREHPVRWNAPTRILYGSCDNLTAYETIAAFAEAHGAELTVMENGEHWFHTEKQMRFLAGWIMQDSGNQARTTHSME